jgi:hypothetical protein
MLVSDDVSPDTSLYYLGGQVIQLIDEKDKQLNFFQLYDRMKEKYGISIKLLILTLDWLYLLGLVELSEKGNFRKCF